MEESKNFEKEQTDVYVISQHKSFFEYRKELCEKLNNCGIKAKTSNENYILIQPQLRAAKLCFAKYIICFGLDEKINGYVHLKKNESDAALKVIKLDDICDYMLDLLKKHHA
jgi:histidyl-tRNA synthetase